MDPRTLSFYNLGPNPSFYILRGLGIEEKKSKYQVRQCLRLSVLTFFRTFGFFDKCFLLAKMSTKFNNDMYAKMRSKKDEPLSSIRKKGVRVTGKGPSVTLVASATPIVSSFETVWIASPATSVEEIPTPSLKRPHLLGKEKEKT